MGSPRCEPPSIVSPSVYPRTDVPLRAGTAVQYTLTAHLEPGSSEVHSAELAPPAEGVCVEALVALARGGGGGLPLLLTLVRGALPEEDAGEESAL